MSAKSSQARRKINAFNKAGKIMKYYDYTPARDPITGEVHYLDQPEDIMLDKGADARIAELKATI